MLGGKQPGAQVTEALGSEVLGRNNVAGTVGAGHTGALSLILYHRPGVRLGCISRKGLHRGSLRGRSLARGNMVIPRGQHRQSPLPITGQLQSKECSKVTHSAGSGRQRWPVLQLLIAVMEHLIKAAFKVLVGLLWLILWGWVRKGLV